MPITSIPETLGQGNDGRQGDIGGFTLLYDFEAGTGAPPSAGHLRLNNVAPGSVTHVYFADADRNAVDLQALFNALAAGDLIKIFAELDGSVFAIFSITAISDQSGYYDLTVAYLSGSGALSNYSNLGIGLSKKGSTGATGATGFIAATESVDTTSVSISSSAAYTTWSSAILSHNVTVVAGDKIFADFCATSIWAPGDDTTGIKVGISINGGTPQVVAHFDTSGLGVGLNPGLAGGCIFAAPGTGTYAVALHLSKTASAPAILAASTAQPIRLRTLVVRV